MQFACMAMIALLASGDHWKEKADQRIEKIRQGNFSITVFTPDSQLAANTSLHIEQVGHYFKFGTAVSSELIGKDSIDAANYEAFVTEHFNTIVFRDELTWSTLEKNPYEIDFAPADRLLDFARKNNLAVRGHCLFQAEKKYVPTWFQSTSERKKRKNITRRLQTLIPRYKNKFICWDVNNGMLDGSYFTDLLGPKTPRYLFEKAHRLDPNTPLFVNEHNILGNEAKLGRYLYLVDALRVQKTPIGGIGVQEHMAERFAPGSGKKGDFLDPDKVLRRLDQLARFGLPIHLTQLSFKTADERRKAKALENCFRLAFSHPAVVSIILWGFFEKTHWMGREATLVDKNWHPLPAARTLKRLLFDEWCTKFDATTDDAGELHFRGFFGTYEITTNNSSGETLTARVQLHPVANGKSTMIHLESLRLARETADEMPEEPEEENAELKELMSELEKTEPKSKKTKTDLEVKSEPQSEVNADPKPKLEKPFDEAMPVVDPNPVDPRALIWQWGN